MFYIIDNLAVWLTLKSEIKQQKDIVQHRVMPKELSVGEQQKNSKAIQDFGPERWRTTEKSAIKTRLNYAEA